MQAGPPEAQTTQIAQQFMTGGGTTVVATEEKPWSVHANAGFGYDSNNGLIPSSSAAQVGLDTKGETDGFFRVGAGASYTIAAGSAGTRRDGLQLLPAACTSPRRASICRATA